MTFNNAERGTESIDYRLKLATATFRRRELEAEFRQHTLARVQKQVRISLFFGAFFGVVFWLTDIAALGYNSTTQMLLVARLSVALTVAACFYMLAKYPQSISMPRLTATLAEIVAMCSFMLVILNRPGEMHWHGMSMSILLLVMYLFVPNTFVNNCAVALTTTGTFILLAMKIGVLTDSDMATMSMALIFTNAFGILALHRQESLSRHEFQAQDIERRALATQRQFVAMLSHEFRTPLAIIDTTAQRMGFVLESRLPELTPRVSKIRRAVTRMLSLLDNCLTEERLNTANLVLHTEPVELREFILQSYGESGAQSSPRVHLVLPEAAQWVACDRHLIDIALSNLVNNALKYSPEDSPVTIRLTSDARPGKIAIWVEDEGAGVPPADREQIFEKFFRSNGNQSVPGAGLGLHLARVLARYHRGNVTLAPQSEHKGAIFILTLPVSQPIPTVA